MYQRRCRGLCAGVRSEIGICCSGGGIRSAAFNLGALQSLDQEGLLEDADHLAAVSGGSYIAAAWAIAARESDRDLLEEERAFAPCSPEERWVRNHSSYLVDGVGDTLRLAAVALTGFLANILLFVTLLWAVARPLGWLYAAWQPGLRVSDTCTPGQSADRADAAGCFDGASLQGLGPWAAAAGLLIGASLFVALTLRMFEPGWSWRLRTWRVAVVLLVAGVAVAVVTLLVPSAIVAVRDVLGSEPAPVPAAVEPASSQEKSASSLGLVAVVGTLTTLLALVTQVRSALSRREVTEATSWIKRRSRGVRRVINSLLGALIAPAALIAAALLIVDGGATSATPSLRELAWWAAAVVLTLVMLLFGDATGWSLHPYYKRCLARTFAVKRVRQGDKATATEVPFGEALDLTRFHPDAYVQDGRRRFPELLVCAAANLSDPGAAPPDRGALSFVFGPSRIGCPDPVVVTHRAPWWRRLFSPAEVEANNELVGPLQVDTAKYWDKLGERRRRDITLPAAVAISGAAVAPAMGKMTRPSLRFLLALTNVRLGVWLLNPGVFLSKARRVAEPPRACKDDDTGSDRQELARRVKVRPRQWHLLYEVFGRFRVRSRYLYVTDGGHVDNLGLVELLRRKCRVIVCLDAAGGSITRFSTLGDALAIARAEHDVRITIDPTVLRPPADRVNPQCVAIGRIRYHDGTSGTLVYGKCLVTADAPWSVRAFGEKDALFPTHPTSDQAYGGEMFDAYQALGRHVGERCAEAAQAARAEHFFTSAGADSRPDEPVTAAHPAGV